MNAAAGHGAAPPFPTDHRRPTIAGFAVLLAALGGFLLWSALMPLSSAVVAAGTVVVDSHRKTIKHLEGGVVAELLVREGEPVQAGQVLLRLDDTRLRANREVLRSRLATERARAARLRSEQAGSETVRFPPGLVAQAGADLEVAQVLHGQVQIFETRRAARAGEVEILRRRMEQLRLQIEGLEKQASARGAQLDLVREELEAIRGLEARGHAPRSRRLALERDKEQIEAAFAGTLADLGRDREALGETGLEVAQVERRFQEAVAAELREAEAAEHDLREQLRAVDEQLERTVIRAPVDGRVVALKVHARGAVVEPGEALMDVVPAREPLVVEAQVAPDDIHNVQLGQKAELRFAAYRGRNAPIIDGRVELVSADSLLEPATRTPYYAVRVVVPEAEFAKLGDEARDEPLIPGMPAEVVILTGDRTLLDYLLDPLTDTFRLAFREE